MTSEKTTQIHILVPLKFLYWLDAVAQACNLGCSEGRDQEGQLSRPAQTKSLRIPSSTNGWALWYAP